MATGSGVIDVEEVDFEREVLERSSQLPVVVDFWAPWCGPCRVLGPVLERLAEEHRGELVLAKVDVDRAPRIAQQLGIRSIPAVIAFRDGAVVSEFVGAQPEPAIRQFLAALLPSEADRLAQQGFERLSARDAADAEASFRAALERDARHAAAQLGLASVLAERGEDAEALALLARIPPGPVAVEAERLAAALRTRAAGASDEGALRARLAANPGDLAARLELGRALASQRRFEEALSELLAAVKRDPKHDDGAARKAMLDVFAVLGPRHPLAERFRTELASALFR